MFETVGRNYDYIRKWDVHVVSKADRVKANPLASAYKYLNPWHPTAHVPTKRCTPFTTTDYSSWALQVVGNEAVLAWSSQLPV